MIKKVVIIGAGNVATHLSKAIKNAGFEPKLCRLPYYGYDEENVEQAEQLGMIVTRPNLDSEDNEIEDFFKNKKYTENTKCLMSKFHDFTKCWPFL